jgi:hypothetical protein
MARMAAWSERKGAVEVHVHHPPPLGEIHVLDRPARADAGVDDGVGEAGEVGIRPERGIGDVTGELRGAVRIGRGPKHRGPSPRGVAPRFG